MDILKDPSRLLGTLHSTHPDGDYVTSVIDLVNVATGEVMLRQEGQGQKYDIVVNKREAGELAKILEAFANS